MKRVVDRLPACDRWHRFLPSKIIVQYLVFKGQKEYERRMCSVCKSMRARQMLEPGRRGFIARREPAVRVFATERRALLPSPNWSPPERLFNSERLIDVEPTNFRVLRMRLKLRDALNDGTIRDAQASQQ